MEHDLIRVILSEKIDKVQRRIDSHLDDIKQLEGSIALSREFFDNGSTNSYFVCRSEQALMQKDENRWCIDNLGYSPICLFTEKRDAHHRHHQPDLLRMVVLFKDDADLAAYKLRFS